MRYLKILSLAGIAFLAAVLGARADNNQIAEFYGRAEGVATPMVSPNGLRLAVRCAPQGYPSICIFDLTGQEQPALLGLDSTYRLKDFFWADDEHLIFRFGVFERVRAQSGIQELEVWRAVSYDTKSGKSVMLMSDNRGMADTSNIVSLLPQDADKVLILGWYRDFEKFKDTIMPSSKDDDWRLRTFATSLKTGRTRKAEGFNEQTVDVIFNRYGHTVARMTRNTDSGALSVFSDAGEIYRQNNVHVRKLELIALDEVTGNLVVWLDQDENYGLNYMSLIDGSISPVLVDGKPAGGGAPIIDMRTRSLVGLEYGGDFDTQVFLASDLAKAKSDVEGVMTGKNVRITSWTDDRNKVTAAVESAGRPAEYYLYDSAAGTLSPIGNMAGHLADHPTGNVVPVSYTARDGLTIPAYVSLPAGKSLEDGPFPLIVLPHGGPRSHDNATYDWWSQAYAEAGYAVLRPNFRGSTGSSASHMFAGYGEYGGKMIDDIIDGAAWAVDSGIADPAGYCVAGASYGGYAAMMVAAKDAAHARCAISVNGVTDPVLRLAGFSPGSDLYNEYESMLGAGRFDSAGARSAITPVSQVPNISGQVLVMHGREDTRVPFDQFSRMRAVAGERPNFVFVELDGEDHFLQSTYARSDVLKKSLSFLAANHPAK